VKVGLWVGPFYGDGTKRFATDQPVEELHLLDTGDGTRITPPPPDRVLLPGTPVTVERVEFPTGWIVAKRVVMTPRTLPWVYLTVPGERQPVVLVLPETVASAEDVRVELERYLGTGDAAAFQALPEPQRAAIAKKSLTDGMGAQAVEMAWGFPRKKVVDRPAHTEAWSWPGDQRRAWFKDDKLERWEQRR
jgi:hypothetical protein